MRMYQNIVAIWSGTLGSIPAGWQLCDGTNGTPNLNRFFILGSQGNYAIGDEGGSASHTHAFTTDGHDHDIDPGAGFSGDGAYSHFTDTIQVTGTTNETVNVPPYYELAYMMRMS